MPEKVADPEVRRAQEWLARQPHCLGYPNCDGDLTGIHHVDECPLSERDDLAGESRLPVSELLAAYAAEQGKQYAHMCCDGHTEIGHNDSTSEQCPLCRAESQLATLREGLRDLVAKWESESSTPHTFSPDEEMDHLVRCRTGGCAIELERLLLALSETEKKES